MGDDEAVARLHLVDEVDVVLEDVGEFDREAVGAARRVDRDIERAVDGAAQHPLLGLERVLDDVRAEAVLGAGHRKRRRLVDAPRQRLDLAVQVRQLDHVARADHVEALADVREAAQFREVRKLELQAAEDLVERVVAADRDGDEFEGRGARRRGSAAATASDGNSARPGSGSGFWICAPTAARIAPATTQDAMTPKRRGCGIRPGRQPRIEEGRVTTGHSRETRGADGKRHAEESRSTL